MVVEQLARECQLTGEDHANGSDSGSCQVCTTLRGSVVGPMLRARPGGRPEGQVWGRAHLWCDVYVVSSAYVEESDEGLGVYCLDRRSVVLGDVRYV